MLWGEWEEVMEGFLNDVMSRLTTRRSRAGQGQSARAGACAEAPLKRSTGQVWGHRAMAEPPKDSCGS